MNLARLTAAPFAPVLLILLGLVMFWPGQTTLPPVDRDEARFAQASRQMVETGDLVDIRLLDEARHKKPIGIYWMQAASAALLGEKADNPIWPYRLPSLIGALAAVLMTWVIARAMLPGLLPPERVEGAAFLAAAMMAGSVLLNVEARLAKTDAMLLVTVLIGQWGLWHAFARGPLNGWRALAFWLAQGAGILIKGPLTAMVCGLTALALIALRREVRWLGHLQPLWGAPLALAIAAAWLVPIMIITDGAFLQESLINDMLAKVPKGQEGHGAPPGYHLGFFWLAFWPMAFFAGLAIPWVWQNRGAQPVVFALAWILPTWIAFELIATKLMHYVLPTYPAIAILTAAAWMQPGPLPGAGWWRWIVGILAVFVTFTLMAVFAAFGPVVDGRLMFWGTLAALATLGGLVAVAVSLRHGQRAAAMAAALVAAACVYSSVFGGLLPTVERPWIARAIAREAPATDKPIAIAGFREVSTALMLGTGTRIVEGGEAVRLLEAGEVEVAAVSQKEIEAFEAARAEAGLRLREITRFEGFNYANGDAYEITLFRKEAGEAE